MSVRWQEAEKKLTETIQVKERLEFEGKNFLELFRKIEERNRILNQELDEQIRYPVLFVYHLSELYQSYLCYKIQLLLNLLYILRLRTQYLYSCFIKYRSQEFGYFFPIIFEAIVVPCVHYSDLQS